MQGLGRLGGPGLGFRVYECDAQARPEWRLGVRAQLVDALQVHGLGLKV